jgi:erythronate-4-phosphate dehydrogenase
VEGLALPVQSKLCNYARISDGLIVIMKIVADENIPYVAEAFRKLGDVVTYPGRRIDSRAVRDAGILLVRSITRVDEHLLRGSGVRLVATATIGYDHIDLDYLRSERIEFASAAGCNANSVAEYVVAALLILARRYRFSLSRKTIGVVGVGKVGSRVVEKTNTLGMSVLQNDPPLERKTGKACFRTLDELLPRSDILTLHVPLTCEGQDATYHMADESLFRKMKNGSFLINTSRGAVVSNTHLVTALKQGRLEGAVLDVWENEPKISEDLLRAVDLGTPHIAGYSLDGKTNATVFIYRAACHFLNLPCEWELPLLPSPPHPKIALEEVERNDEEILSEIVKRAYDIERDDKALREILNIPSTKRKRFFDELRSGYPLRREFGSFEVKLGGVNERLRRKIAGIGFHPVLS